MFTSSELERMPVKIERIMRELEEHIMEDIVRRIKINDEITRSADWQIYRLVQMGKSSEEIKKYIQRVLKLTDKEIDNLYEGTVQSGYARDKKLYEAIGKKFIPFKENAELQQFIKSVIRQTKSEMLNITQTLGFAIEMGGKRVFTPLSEYLQRTLDRAVFEVASGTFDYNTTLKKVVQEMTRSGLRTVDYETGWSNRVEVAARRALMTGINQVTNKINERNADELGTDYFEVSWHATARPEHQVWQGRVYTRKELEIVCGLGTVTGLLGANCYHSYYPFIPGISKRQWTDEELDRMNAKENTPKKYKGKEYTTYEATQRQRHLETLMRKQRREIKLLKSGGASIEDITNAQAKYRLTMDQYKKFSDAMGLPHQIERVYTDGLGRVDPGGKLSFGLKNTAGQSIIKVNRTTLKGPANSITQVINKKGGIDRNYYDSNGWQYKQISNNNHGNPKAHPYGINGEHAHDYIYDKDGNLTGRSMRELTEQERKENSDIL